MLTLRALRKSTNTGDRVELILNGPSRPPQLENQPIFFELDGTDATDLTVLDGFVGAVIHCAMEAGQPLHVEGRLTRTCLRRLTEYQKYWSMAQPERCSVVRVTADEIVADQGDTRELPAVAGYSGGVDSSFTVLRHAKGLVGMDTIPLDAVLIVHGMSSRSDDHAGSDRLLDRLQPVIEELGLRRYVVRTNVKEVAIQDWMDSYPAQLVSCLHMVSHRHSKALFAGVNYATTPLFQDGGNPISVPLLSTSRLKVICEGADYGRVEKIALLLRYPEIARSLRFCFSDPDPSRNCGRCMKCVITYICFRAAGVEKPECFDVEVDESIVGDYDLPINMQLNLRYELLEHLWRRPELADLTARFSAPIFRCEEATKAWEAANSVGARSTRQTDGAPESSSLARAANFLLRGIRLGASISRQP